MQSGTIVLFLDIMLLLYIVFSTVYNLKFIRKNKIIPTSFILFWVLCTSHALSIYLGRISFEGVEKFHIGSTLSVRGESSQPWVFLVYRIIIFVVLVLLNCFGTNKKKVQSFKNDINRRLITTGGFGRIIVISWVLLLLAPLCVLLSPDPIKYFMSYGTATSRALTSTHPDAFFRRHEIISLICLWGICIFSLVCWFETRKTRAFFSPRVIFGLVIVGLLTFIEGKRNSVFLVFYIIILIAYYETRVVMPFYILLIVILVVFIVIYPYFGKTDVTVSYEYSQNTFFRDNITLPCIVNSHLSYNDIMGRGKGALFIATIFVPRKFYPDKPYSSPHYVTRYLLGKDMNPEDDLVGWGYGVGFIEEGLVNFGYLGALAYTFLIIFFCRCADYSMIRYGTIMCLLQGLLVYSCLFSLHIVLKLFLLSGLPLLLIMKFTYKTEQHDKFFHKLIEKIK